jgi:hypothetical protein
MCLLSAESGISLAGVKAPELPVHALERTAQGTDIKALKTTRPSAVFERALPIKNRLAAIFTKREKNWHGRAGAGTITGMEINARPG